jgi:hypothetical protein
VTVPEWRLTRRVADELNASAEVRYTTIARAFGVPASRDLTNSIGGYCGDVGDVYVAKIPALVELKIAHDGRSKWRDGFGRDRWKCEKLQRILSDHGTSPVDAYSAGLICDIRSRPAEDLIAEISAILGTRDVVMGPKVEAVQGGWGWYFPVWKLPTR